MNFHLRFQARKGLNDNTLVCFLCGCMGYVALTGKEMSYARKLGDMYACLKVTSNSVAN